ncbi:pilus assembly protein PilP [Ectothiorhodospira shaposhnikovii]|uniref:pilus assembly protein PilP n=1 Tax=Ectothiorhodospira shaposhnikovii TaxID=1054 RepID=UPI001EE90F46|nr:pilus assembly protein PilP [Ectothiorhodospira shaposhnikovii]MCG5513296.1 pilus assembly protein PilP [Ectothiorhodospira shaposhnikovii]
MADPRHPQGLAGLLVAGLLAVTIPGLTGCGSDLSDLQRYVEQTKQRPGGRIEPIPEIVPHEVFTYPGHERDPFDSAVIITRVAEAATRTPSGVTIDVDRTPEYLERFPLDTLRMVGTLEQGGMQWALIRTPERTIQRVTEGNYLGQNHGRIQQISPSGIDITEIVPDGFGGYMERSGSIALTE